jgi:SnoaL-like domain
MGYQDEQVLRALAGRAAITDLDARLNRAQETGDVTAWLAGFLPEATLTEPGNPPRCGHRDLEAYLQAVTPGRIHLSADGTVDVSGVTARHESSYLVLNPGSNGTGLTVEAYGRRRDELVYERGDWYIAARRIVPFGAETS